MRTLAVAAITSLIALALASVASAATPSVSMVWTNCVGAGCGAGVGTSNIVAGVGDILTLDILITPNVGVSAAGMSYDISASGVASAWTRPGSDAINDTLGLTYSYQGGTGGTLAPSSATYSTGILAYVGGSGATCPAAFGNLAATLCGTGPFITTLLTGSDLGAGIIGSFMTNPGGPVGNQFTLATAEFTVMPIPEPATGGLLALGLGALAFIGRRRA